MPGARCQSKWTDPPRATSTATLVVIVIAGVSRAQDRPAPFCLPSPNPSGHPLFGTPSARLDLETVGGVNYSGQGTHAALGDLNGDGLPDVASTLARQNLTLSPAYVSVCMNLGNGVFGPPTAYPAGHECCAVEIGDFDRDGHLDLAVANAMDNTVSILFNQGDGRFGAPVNYAVGQQPRSLGVGDLNGDGWPDIVVLNCLSNDVSILFNQGDGTFAPETRFFVGNVTQRGDPNLTFPYPGPFLALGDFNRDGAPDIAIPGQTRVRLLMNNGSGGFAPAAVNALLTAGDAYCIAVGDLNRDGKLDLAVACTASGDNGLNILMGRGDGTFDPAVAYNADPIEPGNFVFTNHVALGDIDGDGFLDVAVGSEYSYGRVPIFRNRGDGTFSPKEFVNCDYRSWYVNLVDLRGRGRPDLAVLAAGGRSPLKVHLNDGAGKLLGYTVSFVTASWPTGSDGFDTAAVADIDGDDALDLVATVGNKPYQVNICRGLGTGGFQTVSTISLGPQGQANGEGVALADIDGDHRPDLIVADAIVGGGGILPGKIWAARSTGGFNFGPPVAYPLADATPGNVVAADLNGDGRLDLAAWSTEIHTIVGQNPVERRAQVLLNRGDGTFQPPVAYVLGAAPWNGSASIAVADLDRDGHPDLVGLVGSADLPGSVSVLHNRGDGIFEPWSVVPVATQPLRILAVDVNGDGFADLAVMHRHGYPPTALQQVYLTILYNDGTGHFPTRSEYINSQLLCYYALATGDFNGDGHPDLALDGVSMRTAVVLLNRGDGTFDPPVAYGALGYDNEWITALFAGDFDHSGRTGLLALREKDRVSFLPNLSCGRCWTNCDQSTTPPVLNVGDFACFLERFAVRDPVANCDGSLTPWGAPSLNVLDFVCFLNRFAAGCR